MKLVFDTDIGIDDAIALLMVLADPQTELLALTTVMGNVPVEQASHNAAVTLDMAAAPDIPIYQGCAFPLMGYEPEYASHVHGADGLAGLSQVHTERQPQPQAAPLALVELARQHSGQASLLALGPLTNLAVAIRLDPHFLGRWERVMIMGGSVEGKGNATAAAEFNIYADPEAAALVFAHAAQTGLMIEVLSWEATLAHPLTQADWLSLTAGDSPLARFVQQLGSYLAQIYPDQPYLWPDPLAAMALLDSAAVQAQVEAPLEVITSGPSRGHTLVDYRPYRQASPNARLVQQLDMGMFGHMLRRAVNT